MGISRIAVGEMFHVAPALLHALARKCHDANYQIPADVGKELEGAGLIKNGAVPEDVKQFILKNINLSGEKISMQL